MGQLATVYICNHSHTDIGFTDYQEVCFRQHGEFIDQALDLIERTADYPSDARYRWTCETTGPLVRYLNGATEAQRERFLHWHRQGFIDVTGMQYNLTPLLNVEQMHRTLYPIRALRELGVNVTSAMQDDVNGVSWLFADLLTDVGIDFYTAAINPVRGRRPQPFPGAFNWEGPSGKRLLVWNGFHYLFGRSQAKLGNEAFVERFLPAWIETLEQDEAYPYDFLYCEATHPVRVDNGPPDLRMSDFVRSWNEAGRTPRLELTTVTAFGKLLRERDLTDLPILRGDWTDHWADGVGSSALETGLNRHTHEHLLMGETLASWALARGDGGYDRGRVSRAYEQSTLYDEHTWGAYTSIEASDSLFTRAQWNKKANYAYDAAMEAHDVLARHANAFRATVSREGPEGMFNLGDLEPDEAFPPSGQDQFLVVNTLPWERTVLVDAPQARGKTAPVGMLDCFFNRNTGWGGAKPLTPLKRYVGRVPGSGYVFLGEADEAGVTDLACFDNGIENAFYRIRVDPSTGALSEFYDKILDHDFAGSYRGLGPGQYLYETVASDDDRLAIANQDFSLPDFYIGRRDTPWERRSASDVRVGVPTVADGQASIEVEIAADGIARGTCVFRLETNSNVLSLDWTLDKLHVEQAEAVFIAFPFNLGSPTFHLDLNGVPARPNEDQLNGTSRDWYPTGRWVNISDGDKGVNIVPLDAPLVQLGGITTGLWADTLDPEGPTLMSWALNNHWLVNFRASQGGRIPLRYRLQTHRGSFDPLATARFAAEAVTAPLVLRDAEPLGADWGQFLESIPELPVLLHSKPADTGDGIIFRVQNLSPASLDFPLTFNSVRPQAACLCSPLEEEGDPIPVVGKVVTVSLSPFSVCTLKVTFNP